MEFIRQIYKKFFPQSHKDNKDDLNHYKSGMIFSVDVDEEYNRHVNIYIPEHIDADKIVELSYAYVDTLLDMSSGGKLIQELLQTLEDSIDKNKPEESLLFENIIALFVEHSQIRSDPSDPMVQPLSVFRNK